MGLKLGTFEIKKFNKNYNYAFKIFREDIWENCDYNIIQSRLNYERYYLGEGYYSIKANILKYNKIISIKSL
ncbi:MAG: hypothetical protein GX889_05870 [Clostridiales bacterium]|mgnify:CR=1 FL=1|nr:hypothetical protein [Clostridiales bacterium]